jgi:hypothetical protein
MYVRRTPVVLFFSPFFLQFCLFYCTLYDLGHFFFIHSFLYFFAFRGLGRVFKKQVRRINHFKPNGGGNRLLCRNMLMFLTGYKPCLRVHSFGSFGQVVLYYVVCCVLCVVVLRCWHPHCHTPSLNAVSAATATATAIVTRSSTSLSPSLSWAWQFSLLHI